MRINTVNSNINNPILVGQAKFDDGSAAAPSISFTNDTDTGLFRIGANAIGISTMGATRVQITDTGVGFGVSPAQFFHVRGPATVFGSLRSIARFDDSTAPALGVGPGFRFIGTYSGGDVDYGGISAQKSSATTTNTSTYLSFHTVIDPATTPTERFRITSNNSFEPVTNGVSVLGSPTVGFKGIYFDYTNTATVGAVTMNKPSGRVNIAAAGTSVVVTNTLVTAASHVFAVLSSADTTGRVTSVVAANGSFTINTVAVTAQASFDFLVINTD